MNISDNNFPADSISVDFEKYIDKMVPVIVQDADTNIVLMLGFMNNAALEKTRQSGLVTFFSRSKKRLWTKGESSNYYLHVVDIRVDCDKDTLLIKAKPDGPVCHTGADTCFNEKNDSRDFLVELEQVIEDRKNSPTDASYTSGLFKKGINAVAQKVGEEAVELVIESKDDDAEKFKNEAADLLFHYMILLSAKDCGLKDVIKILQARRK